MNSSDPTAPAHVPNNINFPRITEEGFIASIFTFLAFAIIGVGTRISLRVFKLHTFDLDDVFLIVALAALTAACAIISQLNNMMYLQIYASLHLIPYTSDIHALMNYHNLLEAASVLEWVAIFFAKFSLLLFFRKLVNRVQKLEIWWWVVTALVFTLGGICIPLGFIVCSDFSEDFLNTCAPALIANREDIYTDTTVTLDIISDLLVLSIPISLLWIVKIDLRRKLALASLLCLSVLMIILAIVRVAAATLPGDVTDTSWLFFWQTLEAALAVTMVVLTSFRSLFGTDSATTAKRSAYVYNSSNDLGAHASNKIRDRYNKLDGPCNGVHSTIRSSKFDPQGQPDEELAELDRFVKDIRITKELSQTSSSPTSAD